MDNVLPYVCEWAQAAPGGAQSLTEPQPVFPAMSGGEDEESYRDPRWAAQPDIPDQDHGEIGSTTLGKYAKRLEEHQVTPMWLKNKFGKHNRDMVAILDFLFIKLNWDPLGRLKNICVNVHPFEF